MTASSSRWFVVVIALVVPAPALAQPAATGAPTEEQVEAGRALYKEARELHRQGRLREALDKALEAYRTAPTPVTALASGEMLVEAGRLVEARDLLRGVPLLPVSPRESDKGRESRQQASSLAGQLDMRIPKIAFADRPRGMDLMLDGKPVVAADATAWQGVDPGAHVVQVRQDERPCATVNLSLSEGEERTVDLRDAASSCHVAPPPPPAPPPPSTLPPVAPSPRAPPPPPEPAATSSSARWIGAAAVGTGVVALGVGSYLALSAKSRYDAVAAECPARGCNQDGFDQRNSARSRADVGTGFFVVGAAAVVGGGLFWWLAPSGAAPVQAVVGPGSLNVVGAF